MQAFKHLDRNGSGVVDIDDAKAAFNARAHPDVRQGRKTEDDILLEFLDTFETHHNLFVRGRICSKFIYIIF